MGPRAGQGLALPEGTSRIAALPDCYAIDESTGLDRSDVERFFDDMESRIPPIIDRLKGRGALSRVEQENFTIFTAFAQTRVPRFKAISDHIEERLAREALYMMVVQ